MVDLYNVSWLAIIIGTVLGFVLGWLWYSPVLFVKKWAEGIGANMEETGQPPIDAMITQFLGMFLLAWIVALFADSGQYVVILLIVLTFLSLQYANNTFVGKSMYAKMTEAGYIAASTVIMIIVQMVL